MRRYWPGPLTLVVGADPRTVAVRLPDHDALREVLRRAGGPVVATSANPSGTPAATSPDEVARAFDGRVDVILDGGPAAHGRESSIVRVRDDGGVELLREGHIPRAEIAAALGPTVVVVCSGNTCRSPMAAAILVRDLAQLHGVAPAALAARGITVRSAGILAGSGNPASPGAIEAARRAGLSLDSHRSRQLTPELAAEADLILAMSYEHELRIRQLHPAAGSRVLLLDPGGNDVADPFGGSVEDYLSCFRRLEGLIRARLPEVAAIKGQLR
jgi:protein-tyrosine phosphatase